MRDCAFVLNPSGPVCVVQARLTSQRLPGKALRLCRGKPMLAYVIERLWRCRGLSAIVIATSDHPVDDAIVELCQSVGVAWHRGPLDDVMARFVGALKARPTPSFVRISGDSPLIDPAIVDHAVALFLAEVSLGRRIDLVTNVQPRSFPKGQSVEVIASDAFLAASSEFVAPADREHVTPFFYRHPERFRIVNFAHAPNLGHVQLSVDTRDDFDHFEKIVSVMKRPHWDYGLEQIIDLCRTQGAPINSLD